MEPLDKGSAEPLPLQIKRLLADRIRSGLLAGGERLPTVRQLAAQLGVSPVTVVQAYAALEAAGLVQRRHGAGVFVRERPGPAAPYSAGAGGDIPGDDEWQEHLPDHIPRSLSWPVQLRDLGPEVVQMQSAVVHADLLPVADLVHDLRHAVMAEPQLLATYSPVAGLPRLREAAARYITATGLPLRPEAVMITAGATQGIDLVARTFVGPGDTVAVESPTYPPAVDLFRARGARVVPVPVDAEGLQVHALADLPGLRLVYTIPAYQNPTGTVLSRRRRADLLELARERRLLILEDDLWREIHFGKPPPPPLKAQDSRGHVIYIKSFGKLVAAGLRVGVLAASGRIFHRLLAAKGVVDQGTALLPQVAIQSLLDSPRMTRHLRRLTAALRERRDALLRVLAEQAPRGVRWTEPAGGMSVWVTLPPGWDTEALLPRALERGLCFAPGAAFFPGEPEPHHLRLSYGLGSVAAVRRGAAILCQLLREGPGRGAHL